VLLNNGNYPSFPIAHAVHVKKSYENMYLLMTHFQCGKYIWNISGTMKAMHFSLAYNWAT
jgi:hypothetical protein